MYADKYGPMFPGLAPLADEEELLLHIGSAGGVRDGGPLARQPGCDDAQIPAGSPFFGQFIAHDITAADLSAIVRGIDR